MRAGRGDRRRDDDATDDRVDLGGLGVGLALMPNTVIAMNSVHARFVVAMFVTIAALVCAFGLPGKRAARALQEERRREGPVAGVLAEFE
jgi:hypothetical protein